MPDEETTTQTEVDETTQTPEETGIGDAPAQTEEQTESTTEGEESIDWRKRYEDGNRKITEQGQQLAALQQQYADTQANLERHQNALAAIGSRHVAEQMTPVQRAEHDLKQAHESYDPVAISNATVALNRAEMAEGKQASLQEFANIQRMQQELPQAVEALGLRSQADLGPIMQKHNQPPLKAAMSELLERGGPAAVAKWAAQFDKAERERAETANLLRTADGQGRGALGGDPSAQNDKWLFFEDWAQCSDAQKEAYRNSTEQLKIYGAPEGFDPMKD